MIGTKILFLEDDTLYQESIKDILEENEFIVETCNNGEEFLEKIFNNIYDLYILDLQVPNINGFKILEILKEYNDTTMKLVLTSIPNSLIKSFKYGCDDYQNKNIDVDELLLHVKSLIKRSYKTYNEKLKINENIYYDLFNKNLYKNKEKVETDIQSIIIFDYLVKNRGDYISSNELEEKTYPSSSKSKMNVIRYHIWNLRNIIGKNLIECKKKVGYRLLPLD